MRHDTHQIEKNYIYGKKSKSVAIFSRSLIYLGGSPDHSDRPSSTCWVSNGMPRASRVGILHLLIQPVYTLRIMRLRLFLGPQQKKRGPLYSVFAEVARATCMYPDATRKGIQLAVLEEKVDVSRRPPSDIVLVHDLWSSCAGCITWKNTSNYVENKP
ncbi:unnamed protein product, partial [Ectocarpus sp. 12 AP-2014]